MHDAAGQAHAIDAGQLLDRRRAASRAPAFASTRAASKWICSERMPGVRSSNPASGCARSVSSSACTWKRSTRSSTGAPNSTSRLLSPARRTHIAACVAEAGSSSRTDGLSARGAGCGIRSEAHACRPAAAGRSSTVRRVDDGHRADEAAEARAVRPEDHRHVAGEVDAADGVGVVVDVGRMQAGFAAVAARPAWASAR